MGWVPGLEVCTDALRVHARAVERVRATLEDLRIEGVIEGLAQALPGGTVEAEQAHAAATWRLIVSDDLDDVDAVSGDLRRAAAAYDALERRVAATVARVFGLAR